MPRLVKFFLSDECFAYLEHAAKRRLWKPGVYARVAVEEHVTALAEGRDMLCGEYTEAPGNDAVVRAPAVGVPVLAVENAKQEHKQEQWRPPTGYRYANQDTPEGARLECNGQVWVLDAYKAYGYVSNKS